MWSLINSIGAIYQSLATYLPTLRMIGPCILQWETVFEFKGTEALTFDPMTPNLIGVTPVTNNISTNFEEHRSILCFYWLQTVFEFKVIWPWPYDAKLNRSHPLSTSNICTSFENHRSYHSLAIDQKQRSLLTDMCKAICLSPIGGGGDAWQYKDAFLQITSSAITIQF